MGAALVAPPGLWAIVVAAGSGSRFGGEVPKQYTPLAGQRLIDHSLIAMRHWCGDRVVLVVSPDRVNDPEPLAGVVVAGGTSRSQSVRNGLAVLPADAQMVLVHDAARPLVDHEVVGALLQALIDGAPAAIPGLAVTDTIKRVHDGWVSETVPRDDLVAVQTPQAFVVSALRAAHATEAEATDDAALMEQVGHRVAVVPGAESMRKVTTFEDIRYLEGHFL
jgi:2-C-methyl-D-erythritol 4-phosphate cytidylyltransferase